MAAANYNGTPKRALTRRDNEFLGDLAAWERENAEDNGEQLERLRRNLRKVRELEPYLPVIFTTSERDYAVESFDVRPTDYLVKPLQQEKVARCMERLREYLSRPSSIPLSETSAWGHAEPVDVPFVEILYAQYANHIVDVHTTQGVFCTRQSFQDFAAQFPHTGRFCVCGRGLVINLSQVAKIKDNAC